MGGNARVADVSEQPNLGEEFCNSVRGVLTRANAEISSYR